MPLLLHLDALFFDFGQISFNMCLSVLLLILVKSIIQPQYILHTPTSCWISELESKLYMQLHWVKESTGDVKLIGKEHSLVAMATGITWYPHPYCPQFPPHSLYDWPWEEADEKEAILQSGRVGGRTWWISAWWWLG